MLRNLFRILAIVLVFAFARYLYYLIKKTFSETMGSAAKASNSTERDELHRDPICGTFVADGSSLTLTRQGVTHYFCSVACRDKFQAA
jgi:YHS domain-containing protein